MSKVMNEKNNKEPRKLPSVEKILERAEIQAEVGKYSRVLVTQAVQDVERFIGQVHDHVGFAGELVGVLDERARDRNQVKPGLAPLFQCLCVAAFQVRSSAWLQPDRSAEENGLKLTIWISRY